MSPQILVIEDEPVLLENLLELLRIEAYEVLGASDGIEGLTLAQEYLPDLILCDIAMPRLDGYGVLTALRSDPATHTIPLIFLTGKSERFNWRRGMALGANDYIIKPFSFDDVINAIQARLDRREAVQEEYMQAITMLRQSVVFALPPELRAPLEAVLSCADELSAGAHIMESDGVHRIAQSMFDAARTLQRQIENYLIFTQLDILGFDPDRVIVRRERCLHAPQPVIESAAREVVAVYDRSADLVLDLDDQSVCMGTECLQKIMEELIGYSVLASMPGTPVTIRTVLEQQTYTVQITARNVSLPPELIAHLMDSAQESRRTIAHSRELRAPILGVIVAHHVIRVHGGTLAWHTTEDRELRFSVQLACCQPEMCPELPREFVLE